MAYTNSPLVTYKRITNNKTSPRNHAIDTITIHCIVGQWTAKQGCDYFATTDRECSANYVVGKDGSIGLSVEEKDRSWCSSSSSNDHRAITIEVASDTTHPYAVTDEAYNALIKLVADICKRNGIKKLLWKADKSLIGQVDKQNMTVHRWFANKACPGEYLYSRHSDIAAKVNALLGESSTATESTESATTTSVLYRVQVGAYSKKANADAQLKKVKAAGFDAIIVQVGNLYKVQVGAFSKKSNAEAQLTKVKAAGFDAIVTTNASTATTTTTEGTSSTTDTAKTIWDFFIGKGLNAFAVAGIMGNLKAESSLNPQNLQQTYEKKLGYTDASYTKAVDDGTYTNFVKDSAGYGLAQWTYWSRKQALLEYAQSVKKSIGDLDMQLEFMWKELQGYTSVMNVLKAATSVKQASDAILTGYERPADQSDAVKTKRAGYGQTYYSQYASGSTAATTTTFTPYKVKVTTSALNIRKSAGTGSAVVGCIRDRGVYTIVAESSGTGATKWGKLKSGAGWISLDYTQKV